MQVAFRALCLLLAQTRGAKEIIQLDAPTFSKRLEHIAQRFRLTTRPLPWEWVGNVKQAASMTEMGRLAYRAVACLHSTLPCVSSSATTNHAVELEYFPFEPSALILSLEIDVLDNSLRRVIRAKPASFPARKIL